MTPKIVTQIDLTEIPAIDISCNKCGSKIVITLPKQEISNSARCPGCGTPLWSYTETIHQTLTGIIRTLGTWKEECKGAPFTLGFSLLQPSDRAPSGTD
jgi:hypothetical protein